MSLAVGERVLVTGANGFVGSKLITAMALRWPSIDIFRFGGDAGTADIRVASQVEKQVVLARPTYVIHLAAVSAVTVASQDPSLAWDVNLHGTLNLLNALSRCAPSARLLHVSTSEVYGFSLNEGPADERTLLRPANVYALSKASADLAAQQRAAEDLNVIIARPFNHIGSGQSEKFVVPAFAAQIAAIESGKQPAIIKVGSLEDWRDFLSVDDVIDAYIQIIQRFDNIKRGEIFNIASGRAIKIGDILSRLLSLSRVDIQVEVSNDRLRKTPIGRIVGNADQIRRVVDWRPTRDLNDVLFEMLNYQRALPE